MSKSVERRIALQKKGKKKPKRKAKAPAVPAAPTNIITDRTGTVFDKEKHAHMADGTPHVDSAGKFIAKESHYDGAKKAHYDDTFRHA